MNCRIHLICARILAMSALNSVLSRAISVLSSVLTSAVPVLTEVISVFNSVLMTVKSDGPEFNVVSFHHNAQKAITPPITGIRFRTVSFVGCPHFCLSGKRLVRGGSLSRSLSSRLIAPYI